MPFLAALLLTLTPASPAPAAPAGASAAAQDTFDELYNPPSREPAEEPEESEPSPSPKSEASEAAPPEEDDTREDPGVLGRYFPLTAYDDLEARTAELKPYFFLGGLLPFGQVWLPLMMAPEPAPEGFWWGALWLLTVHLAPHAACLAAVPCSVFFIGVPVLGPFLVIAAIVLNLGNAGCFLANNFYFAPTAVMNEYDRAVRAEPGSSSGGRAPPASQRY